MPASEGNVGAEPVLAPLSGVDQESTPYRYWWLVMILLSLGGWAVVISLVSLVVAVL